MPNGTLLNVNGPPGEVKGACACRLGKRVYNDRMELTEEGERGRRRYRLYGDEPSYEHEPAPTSPRSRQGLIAVTPIHFDLTDQAGVGGARGLRPGAPAASGHRGR
jgi:5'-nucleotidase